MLKSTHNMEREEQNLIKTINMPIMLVVLLNFTESLSNNKEKGRNPELMSGQKLGKEIAVVFFLFLNSSVIVQLQKKSYYKNRENKHCDLSTSSLVL